MAKLLNQKYRRSGGYIQRHEDWLSSPAYRDLKPIARCLLEEFQRIYRPDRNGKLSISVLKAAKLINASKESVSRAFYELAEHGFLKPMKDAYWIERMAREWTLTFESLNGREPTDDWKNWTPGIPVFELPRPKKIKIRRRDIGQSCPKNRTGLSQI